jgi:hypothetical protein
VVELMTGFRHGMRVEITAEEMTGVVVDHSDDLHAYMVRRDDDGECEWYRTGDLQEGSPFPRVAQRELEDAAEEAYERRRRNLDARDPEVALRKMGARVLDPEAERELARQAEEARQHQIDGHLIPNGTWSIHETHQANASSTLAHAKRSTDPMVSLALSWLRANPPENV